MHGKSLRLLNLMLLALAFILLVFPMVFRSSLIRPLQRLREGMRHVNEGDLQTEIEVGVRDEVGQLTAYFNETTRSLRRAEAQLKAHAETLEQRVAERMAALNRSLEDLKATQAQLVQQEKLASLGSLTAGIAHEIKNPLNFINNFAEVNQELAQELREALAQGEDLDAILADLEQNAGVIAQHGRRADAIVRGMMQHASGGSGRREAADVNALVKEYVELAYHGRRAQDTGFQVDLVRHLGDDIAPLELVPQEIGRVVLNLLSNAFDAVHARAGRVNGTYRPTVHVATRQAADSVEIRVKDNGEGIPHAVRDRVFEPFFTTKPTGTGTGLGLSLSYDIVTQGHGGTLTVESEPGQGTTFIVSLPRQQPAASHEI
jgi:signal transduction histidine kinase